MPGESAPAVAVPVDRQLAVAVQVLDAGKADAIDIDNAGQLIAVIPGQLQGGRGHQVPGIDLQCLLVFERVDPAEPEADPSEALDWLSLETKCTTS